MQQINAFRESGEEKLEFPASLNNVERKFVHHVCAQLGLSSKSKGKGDGRFLTVFRR
eukprot:CAMPEP_0196796372 /NCGR_PEP_ID=MMETSP1104-20130614/37450_1 /TAXON_ID=33652 /ORGANISM="Cafeteria sp., Strain Caron Lab Isolate" /LENGTH=56 /DNA_ID=CAMNT_0042166763 /DNA_START=22 /DNA_END=188 /DNA_ORIENTATION=-